MSRLIETIRVMDGKPANLGYHADRMKRAWRDVFNIDEPFSLKNTISGYNLPSQGLYKCRLIYDTEVRSVEFVPYSVKSVNSLRLIYDDRILYPHKFEDRSPLTLNFEQRGDCDDVLIIKEGFVTDTTNANVAFKKGNDWFTPSTCLLPGTMRQNLIDRKVIAEDTIKVADIMKFESFKLINSMLAWEGSEMEISGTTLQH